MSRAVNVLLTCVGRKSYLVGILENSSRLGTLVAVDSDQDATIQYHAPRFEVVPKVVSDPDAYLDALLDLCERRSIDCVIPQNDLDLVELADARDRFTKRGILLAGASSDVTRAVRDKLRMVDWMEEHDLPYPKTWKASEAPAEELPAIVKSRLGQGSARLERASEPSDLEGLDDREVVVQRMVDGTEYNLDILRTKEGRVVSVVPKRKLEMRWGATHKAESIDSDELIDLGIRVGQATGHVGSIDVDVMISERTGESWVIDINPRVGGGFPFTSHFCPEYVDALLAICGGEEPAAFLGDYRPDVRVDREFRYFECS